MRNSARGCNWLKQSRIMKRCSFPYFFPSLLLFAWSSRIVSRAACCLVSAALFVHGANVCVYKEAESLRQALNDKTILVGVWIQDQENLQQAAAAIARLTPPSVPVVLDETQEPSGNNMMTILPNSISSAPDELKELRRRVEQAGFEAMNFDTESEDEERDTTKNLPDSWKIR